MTETEGTQVAKQTIRALASALNNGDAEGFVGRATGVFAPDLRAHICHPINTLAGRDGYFDGVWRPLLAAMPDLERADDIIVAEQKQDGSVWAAATGHLIGTFKNDWLTIPATQKVAFLHYAEIARFEGAVITDIYVMLDLIDLAQQASAPLVPQGPGLPRGSGVWSRIPGPLEQDGLTRPAPSPEESQKTRDLVEAMIAGLMRYDGTSLASMGQERFWHRNMMWYGPGGIGTARGLAGFQTYHQRPFLDFIPDRAGGNHVARIADGLYFASGGWPSITATSSGAPWLSVSLPAGVPLTMRVMDFWRRDGDVLRENWVFIDIPDVFDQLGIDLFAAAKTTLPRPPRPPQPAHDPVTIGKGQKTA